MERTFPRVYYACPCVDITKIPSLPSPPESREREQEQEEEEQEPFNPHSPRANYALYPIEHLLFCTQCNEIRCPRCYFEEALTFFCPRCLNETSRAEVKSESNRCPQSCHDCPVCFAPLQVNRYETTSDPSSTNEAFILSCPYCSWTTLELGISFPRAVNISSQLARIRNGGEVLPDESPEFNQFDTAATMQGRRTKQSPSESAARFFQLADFYHAANEESLPPRDPAQYLARLSSGYATPRTRRGILKPAPPPPPMREANGVEEGLRVYDPTADAALMEAMKQRGYSATTNADQRNAQPDSPLFLADARPVATTLRSKRCKRCRTCRAQLVRPDPTRNSTRYVIKLVAARYVPRLSIDFLRPPPSTTAPPTTPAITPTTTTQKPSLRPNTPIHLLITLTNPLYNPLKVTLATPPTTPGPTATRVTILCPQFDVGANPDGTGDHGSTGGTARLAKADVAAAAGAQPEAGKVWEKGKNWTGVAVEVVPGVVGGAASPGGGVGGWEDAGDLRIPVFVRLEYEEREGGGIAAREMAFWCVLDLGRIGVAGQG